PRGRSRPRTIPNGEGLMPPACVLLLSACLAASPQDAIPPASQSTEAEKIARLQRQIEEEEKQLAAIRQQLDDPDSEYRRAEADFKGIDNQLTKGTRELDRLRKAELFLAILLDPLDGFPEQLWSAGSL